MIRRPWPIVFLAVLHWFSPIPNLVFASYLYDVPITEAVEISLSQDSWFELFKAYFLLPLAGFAIYAFRTWSYAAFLGLMIVSFYGNYIHWQQSPEEFTVPVLIFTYAINILLVGYFLLIPSVRAAYFNPRLRWWEQKPRYRVRVDGQASVGKAKKGCTITDLSVGGALVDSSHRFKLHESIKLHFKLFDIDFNMNGEIVHTGPYGNGGYGIQFVKLTASQRRKLNRATKGLRTIGVESRNRSEDGWNDFSKWLKRLVTTGKGMVPEVPRKAAATAARQEPSLRVIKGGKGKRKKASKKKLKSRRKSA